MHQAQVVPQGQPLQAQTTTIVQQPPANTSYRPGYASKSSAVLGALQLAIGGLCIVFQIAAIVVDASAAFIGAGIWAAAPMIIAGILGLLAAKSKTVSYIVGVMVCSIIASVAAFVLLIIAAIGLGIDNEDNYYYYYQYDTTTDAMRAMNALLIFLAFVELVVSIWASAICCSAACCGNTGPRQGVILPPGQAVAYSAGGQVVMISGGTVLPGTQVVYAQAQPGQVVQPGYAPMQPPAYGNPPTYMAPQPGAMPAYAASAPPPPPAYSPLDGPSKH